MVKSMYDTTQRKSTVRTHFDPEFIKPYIAAELLTGNSYVQSVMIRSTHTLLQKRP